MKNALNKDFIREIKKNLGRFLSIFFIVMLGTAFFAGIRSAGGDMKHTADEFFKRSKMMDIRVISTLGITEDDIKQMSGIDGVESATGGYTKEVLVNEEDRQYVLKLIAVTDGVNEVILTDGRMPEKADEMVMDSAYSKDYEIGDRIRAVSGTDDELSDSLTQEEFTIVGFGNLPYYLDLTRGTGSIGNGSVDAFAMIPADSFCMDQYTEGYIRVEGADAFNSYSDEYKEVVDRVSDEIEEIKNEINTRRYEQVVNDAQKEIDDAEKELDDAQKELDDAKQELEDGKKELDDAKKELEDGKKELDDAKKELEDAEKELSDAKKELEDGEKELSDAKKELDDAKKELEDGEKELADAKVQLANAKQEIADGEKELADAKAELDKGEKELADNKVLLDQAKTELDENGKKLEEAKKELDAAEKQLKDAKPQLDEAKKTLEAGKKELDKQKAELDAAHAEADKNGAALAAAWQEYNAGVARIEEQAASLEDGKVQLEQLKLQLAAVQAALAQDPQNPELLQQAAMLEAGIAAAEEQITTGEAAIAAARKELEAAYKELTVNQAAYDEGQSKLAQADQLYAEGEAQYRDGYAQYAENEAAYEASAAQFEQGKKQYEDGLAQYKAGQKQYENGLAQYEEGKKKWQDGKRQYEEGVASLADGRRQYEEGLAEYEQGLAEFVDGRRQYEEGLAEYEDGLAEFEDGKKKYEDGLAEYNDGKKKYEDALIEYEDGLAEYNDGLAEYEDGLAEYEDAYAEHMPEIEDGRREVADAKADLKRLEKPKLYALDRDMIQSVASLNQDAERMDSLGNVFPVIFFLVAALVSLTAMTRMVDEQRQQIGTLKALGFSSAAITWKYLEYALIPSVAGGIIGIFVGEYIIPKVIIDSYRMMYTSLDQTLIPFNKVQGILAVVLAAGCTGFAAWAACAAKLMERPAQLMRPEAPKSGRRVFLEYITPVWRRMSFTAKSTVRNLFRYKKRLIMTVTGIGACMGLIIFGFGLYDSITDVAKRQYREIFMQDATISIDTEATQKDRRLLQAAVDGTKDVTESMELAEISAKLYNGDTERTATLYVPEGLENLGDFLRFQDRKTHEPYEYPTEGVGLSEKTAAMLGVKVGDAVSIQKGENEELVEAPVTVIVENYVNHYCFMTKETYRELFGEDPDFNEILIKYEDTSTENQSRLGSIFIAQDACTSVNFTTEFQKQIDDMLNTLSNVIWVLLVAAGLLAFVVLYNLNNINITERKRELATLKVLGFRDGEVAMYVYRENIILTIFGIIFGCVVGMILHRFTILTVEVDLMMFGRVVRTSSYIKSALITAVFSLIVNTVMFFSLKKIDMIESLKSVE